jgi:hypothetical protein
MMPFTFRLHSLPGFEPSSTPAAPATLMLAERGAPRIA